MLPLLTVAAVIAVVVGIIAHRHPVPLPALANSLARLRPLEPWAWRDWERVNFEPDAAFLRRQQVWEQFTQMPEPVPVILNWYHELRLQVRMGNGLSRGIFVVGAFEVNEFAFLDRYLKPGMVFVDIGAHEGLYSLFAARRVGPAGRVYAIEPSARERLACQANLELNGLAATIIPCAVGATDGEAGFLVAENRHSGHNSLEASGWEGAHSVISRITVPMRALDSLAAEYGWQRVDVLKMDIEGGETQALLGGSRLFRELRPLVIVEVSDRGLAAQGSSRKEFETRWEELGYRLHHFDYDTAQLMPGAEEQTGDNLVAIPKEMASPKSARVGTR